MEEKGLDVAIEIQMENTRQNLHSTDITATAARQNLRSRSRKHATRYLKRARLGRENDSSRESLVSTSFILHIERQIWLKALDHSKNVASTAHQTTKKTSHPKHSTPHPNQPCNLRKTTPMHRHSQSTISMLFPSKPTPRSSSRHRLLFLPNHESPLASKPRLPSHRRT